MASWMKNRGAGQPATWTIRNKTFGAILPGRVRILFHSGSLLGLELSYFGINVSPTDSFLDGFVVHPEMLGGLGIAEAQSP